MISEEADDDDVPWSGSAFTADHEGSGSSYYNRRSANRLGHQRDLRHQSVEPFGLPIPLQRENGDNPSKGGVTMPAFLARTAMLIIPAAAGLGCGSTDPDPSVFTTVEVTPPIATLFTAAPVNSVALTVVAKDQNGQAMDNVGPPEFSSEDDAVATVGDDGTVTAAGTGTVLITATVTAGDVTKSGTASVTVLVAPAAATVTAPQFAFLPNVVDVSAGGSVTWLVGAIHHTVTFTTPGSPASIPEIQSTSASRVFPVVGSFSYRCDFHPGMAGVVRVH